MAGTDLQQLIDETLQQAVEAMLDAELSVDTADDGHKHHGWSPMYIHKLNALRKCKGLLTRAKKGKKWEIQALVNMLNNKYKWPHVPTPPMVTASKWAWLEWRKKAEKYVKGQRQALHYKQRVRMRLAVSKYAQRVERSRLKSETSKLFYSHISDAEFHPPATEIFHKGRSYEGEEVRELEKQHHIRHIWGTLIR